MDPEKAFSEALLLQMTGRLEEAEKIYGALLEEFPWVSEVSNNRGILLMALGRPEEAIACYRAAIPFEPEYANTHYNLGNALSETGKGEEAVCCYREAIRLDPARLAAYQNLGLQLFLLKRFEEAADCFQRALRIDPASALAANNLGDSLEALGKEEEALASFRLALSLEPENPEIRNHLAIALSKQGEYRAAAEQFQESLRLLPGQSSVYHNLAIALNHLGDSEDALRNIREALACDPKNALAYSNLLTILQYRENDRDRLFEEHRRFAERFEPPDLSENPPAAYANARTSNRPLRIGYVSPDFRHHAVSRFFLPVLRAHDPSSVQVYCYSDVAFPDRVTTEIRSLSHGWRSIDGLDDKEVEGLIREDQIDLLVDLAGHTGKNRLVLFGRKPAPVQLTWLGYPDTTGLSSMDYRITDAIADPPGMTEAFHSERLIRLPRPFLCYLPPEPVEISPLPALTNPFITFGSFNALPKLSPQTLSLWASILKASERFRLLLKARELSSEQGKEEIIQRFSELGVGAERLLLHGFEPSDRSHLERYRDVDIALDSFPYHGTTTTCDALWMGVPVLTWMGNRHASRVSGTLLDSLGLSEWAASGPEEYLAKAQALASDLDSLSKLRGSLRERMRASSLLEPKRLARALELEYRRAWEHYLS